jgi:hypothetical protein
MHLLHAVSSGQKGLRGHVHSSLLDSSKVQQQVLLPRSPEDMHISVVLSGMLILVLLVLFCWWRVSI